MKKEPLNAVYNGNHIDEISLLNYALRDIRPDEEKKIETHLNECDVCLMKVQEFVAIQSGLESGPNVEVPPKLVGKVGRGWRMSEPETSFSDSIPRLIIRLAADGVKLLKESVLPENAEIEWATIPRYAFRGQKAGKERELIYKESKKEKNISIDIVILKDGHESVQTYVSLKEYSNPMRDARVTLKRYGRIVRSKKTDVRGDVMFSELHPAEYCIQIPSKNIEWAVSVVL